MDLHQAERDPHLFGGRWTLGDRLLRLTREKTVSFHLGDQLREEMTRKMIEKLRVDYASRFIKRVRLVQQGDW